MQRYSQPTASPLELRTQNKKTNIVSIWLKKQHPRTRNEECFRYPGNTQKYPVAPQRDTFSLKKRSFGALWYTHYTTQHYTTRESPPQGSPPPGNRRRRPFACGGRRLRYFVVQNACHPPVGVAEKVYLCSATGQNVDSSPDIRSVSFLYRIFAAKEKITRIDP